ncbi:MAG: pyroglutamyl-peptidase I [Anaerolineaceae bacterium]
MKVLLTAFDAFGGESINPAQEAVRLVRAESFDAEIVKMDIPTVFDKSIKLVLRAMKKHKPNVVLCVGQAGGRSEITPERVAINIDDSRGTDNEGNQPVDRTIFADGAAAYFSLLPIKAMVAAMKDAGIPASVSNTAGTFVCNHLMYGVLYHIHKSFPGVRGGFIHVPYIPEQVMERPGVPALPLEVITRGIEVSIQVILDHPVDIVQAGGSVC